MCKVSRFIYKTSSSITIANKGFGEKRCLAMANRRGQSIFSKQLKKGRNNKKQRARISRI